MTKTPNEERAKQLYLQCRKAYKDTKDSSGMVWNDGGKSISMPSHFDDAYNIPAELLFKELQGSGDPSQGARTDFDYRLLRLVSSDADYNSSSLKQNSKKKVSLKKFDVFFQVYFHKEHSAPNLFNQQITLDGIKFTWCSQRTFSHLVSCFESSENLATDKPNALGGDGFPGLYRRRRNERFPELTNESNLHAIKATVQAVHIIDATDQAATAFRDFMSCVNVAQAFGSRNVSLSESAPKPKSAVVYTGVFLVKSDDDKKIDVLWTSSKRHTLPSQSLNMTTSQSKMTFLNNLRKAFCDDSSPAAKRVRYVALEFALAIDTDDSNLRQLGFWRCLEIATRKSSENRKEKDVVKIFQNYHSKTLHWRQQGQLILDTRNTYVHQGVSSKSNKPNDFYLNWSQQYAEAALKILLYVYNNRSTWKTENDIDTFFDHYSQSDRTLVLAGKFLAARNKSRKAERVVT